MSKRERKNQPLTSVGTSLMSILPPAPLLGLPVLECKLGSRQVRVWYRATAGRGQASPLDLGDCVCSSQSLGRLRVELGLGVGSWSQAYGNQETWGWGTVGQLGNQTEASL